MAEIVAPETPHYVPAPETKADGELTDPTTGISGLIFLSVDCAELPIIDLSKIATTEGRLALAQQARDAMSNHGFFYVINHGLTPAEVSRLFLSFNTTLFILEKTERMFDIADIPFARVSEEEKKVYVARMKETGSYQGYKPRQYWVNQTLCCYLTC
jgi:hypothetical protein